MSNQIRYGWNKLLKKVIHVSVVERGLNCNCVCLECGSGLEAVKGEIREHYFRHSENKNCHGGLETALHIMAKQILAENSFITIPGHRLNYTNVRIENVLNVKKPDVTVTADGEDVHFEIRVTHPVQTEKKNFYCSGKHKCIEINLSDKELLSVSPADLERIILNETANKHIIYWPLEKQALVKEENSFLKQIFSIAFLAIIFLFFFNLIMPRKRW